MDDHDRIVVLETKMDPIQRAVLDIDERHTASYTALDTRVKALETRMAWAIGAGAGASLVGSVLGGLLWRLLLGSLLLVATAGCAGPQAPEVPIAAMPPLDPVVALVSSSSPPRRCAGVLVAGREPRVLTAAHCGVAVGEVFVLSWRPELGLPPSSWRLVAASLEADAAVLVPEATPVALPPEAAVMASRRSERGTLVTLVGHPEGLGWTHSRGEVVAYRALPEEGVFLQVTTPIARGDSGGPIFDGAGRVVGIASRRANGITALGLPVPEERLAMAVPVEVFEELLGAVAPRGER